MIADSFIAGKCLILRICVFLLDSYTKEAVSQLTQMNEILFTFSVAQPQSEANRHKQQQQQQIY